MTANAQCKTLERAVFRHSGGTAWPKISSEGGLQHFRIVPSDKAPDYMGAGTQTLVPGRAESLRCRVISPSPALSIYLFVYLFLWCWGLNLGLCARHELYHWASCLDLGQNKSLVYKFLKVGIWNKVRKSLCMWKHWFILMAPHLSASSENRLFYLVW